MKKRDLKTEIKDLSKQDCAERARTIAEELMKLRFRKSSGQLKETHRLVELKRNLSCTLNKLQGM